MFITFTTPWKLYEWIRIHFGLSNGSSVSQRRMNECLGNLRDTICIAHLEDVLCYGRTFDEHLQNVKTVLKHLKEFGIKLNAEICFYFQKWSEIYGKDF